MPDPQQRPPSGLFAFARKLVSITGFGSALGRRLQSRSAAIDRATSAPPPTRHEVPRLIDDLLSNDDLTQTVAEIRLAKAGDTASAPLLEALRSGRAVWERVSKTNRAPAERLCGLLEKHQPRALAEVIGQLWDHPDSHVARRAITARASLGRADLADWMIQLLRDESHPYASTRAECIEKGVDRALAGGWADPALTDRLVHWATNTIANHGPGTGTAIFWAASFLATQRPREAVDLFTDPSVLSTENNSTILPVLKQLTRMNIAVPPAVLRPMLEKALTATEWPWRYAFGDVIAALALSDKAAALEEAESAILHEEHSYEALKLLYEAHGLPKHWATDPPADMPLTEAERAALKHFSNVVEADGQIGNGGISQYFFNFSGNHWRRDAASFDFIGFPEGALTLRSAAEMIATSGASPDREERIKQIAAMSNDAAEKLDKLSGVFWGPPLDAAQYRFLKSNAKLIHRVMAARVAAGMDTD